MNGVEEPTDEECGPKIAELEKEIQVEAIDENEKAGIPEFWRHVIVNCDDLVEALEISDADEEALNYLKDVRVEVLPRVEDTIEIPMGEDDEDVDVPADVETIKIFCGGFTLVFEFAENPFFSNTVLKKTYHVIEDDNEEPTFDKSEAFVSVLLCCCCFSLAATHKVRRTLFWGCTNSALGKGFSGGKIGTIPLMIPKSITIFRLTDNETKTFTSSPEDGSAPFLRAQRTRERASEKQQSNRFSEEELF